MSAKYSYFVGYEAVIGNKMDTASRVYQLDFRILNQDGLIKLKHEIVNQYPDLRGKKAVFIKQLSFLGVVE